LNRQGADVGDQYRSAIFYHSPEQKAIAMAVVEELTRDHVFKDPIVTEITPFEAFYPADLKHQGYYRANSDQPYCRATITPKVTKLRQKYAARLKTADRPS
jgi:peptide-methionine (S)-S-oxide reductase